MKAGASEKYIDSEGRLSVALHTAAAYDHRACVEKLLALGADPFCSNKDCGSSCTCTALSFAAMFNCSNVVEPLNDAGLSPTEPCEDTNHVAPVLEANMKGFCTFLEAVVNCGYDPNSLGPQRCSLLKHALHVRFYQKREMMPLTISSVHLEKKLLILGVTYSVLMAHLESCQYILQHSSTMYQLLKFCSNMECLLMFEQIQRNVRRPFTLPLYAIPLKLLRCWLKLVQT